MIVESTASTKPSPFTSATFFCSSVNVDSPPVARCAYSMLTAVASTASIRPSPFISPNSSGITGGYSSGSCSGGS